MAATIAAMAGTIAVALVCVALWRRPKTGTMVLLVLTLIAQTLQTMGGSALGYVDEASVMLALVVFTARRWHMHGSVRFTGAYALFGLYFVLGLISSVVNVVPPGTWALGAFLVLKGPLLLLGVMQLDWNRRDLPGLARAGVGLLLVVLLSVLINAVVPEAWNSVVGRQDVSYRLGIPSLTGIFDHPVGLGSTMGMAFLAVLAYHRIVERTALTWTLMLATGFAGLLTFRRKSIAAAAVMALAGRLVLPGRKALAVVLLLLAVPAALIVGWDSLSTLVSTTRAEYFTDVDATARTRMTIDSVALALAAFPLGVGFGRYGSAVASSDYSPLYEQMGYTRIHGMGPGERGGFLTDTFWPSLIAETGFLATLCYLAGLILITVPAWKLMRRDAAPHARWLGALVVAWMGQMLVESVVAPVFTGPPMFGPVFIAAGVAVAVHLAPDGCGTPQDGAALWSGAGAAEGSTAAVVGATEDPHRTEPTDEHLTYTVLDADHGDRPETPEETR